MFRVRVIGTLAAEHRGADLPLPSGRSLELFAWLAAHPGRHRRSTVAPVFWPDVSDSVARASLRTALWTLRRSLGDAAKALLVERNEIEIGGESTWVDLRELRALAEAGHTERALAIGSDTLLPGIEAEWADELREDHRRLLCGLLAGAAESAANAGDLGGAAERTRERARLDPYGEDAHRDLLARLADAGDATGAALAHAAFRRRLWADLRVVPSEQTTRLARELAVRDSLPTNQAGGALPAGVLVAEREPFVARVAELAALREMWSDTSRGRGPRVALIGGEGGIGKTRLAARFAADLHGEGRVLFGRASPDMLVPAEALVEAAGLPEGGSAEELFGALVARMEQHAAAGPVLLVVDDVHCADALTLALLRRLVRVHYSARLALVLTHRDNDHAATKMAELAAALEHDCELTRIRLTGMSAAETERLVKAVAGRVEPNDAGRVHERTGGNPLFAREVARDLAGGAPGAPRSAVPASVRDLVASRMAKLSPGGGELLGVVAVLGNEAPLDTVYDVSRETAGIVDLVDELLASGLLIEPARGCLGFSHDIIRQTVYQSMSGVRRAELHRIAAEVVRRKTGDADGSALCDIALHECAAVPAVSAAQAVADAKRATEWAFRQNAYEQAVVVLTRALEVAEDGDRRDLTVRRAVAFQRLTHAVIDPA